MTKIIMMNIEGFLDRRRAFLILFFLVLLSYFNALGGEFVWDDHSQITENPFIRNFSNITRIFGEGNIKTFPQILNIKYYRPLQVATYLIDYRIWGVNFFGFHLTNIFLHFFNAWLTFLLSELISGKKMVSFLSAVFFAVHPINTSAVTYISGRADLIAALLILLSVLYHKKGKSALSFLFFVLALGAKEIAVLLPFLLLFDAISDYDDRRHLIRKVLVVVPFFIILIAYFWFRANFFGISLNIPVNQFVFAWAMVMGKIFISYLKLIIFPDKIYMGHDIGSEVDFTAISGILLLGLTVFVIIKFRKKLKENVFFGAWFLVFLIPQFFMLQTDYKGRVLMAEHWIYLASIGLYFTVINQIVSICIKTGYGIRLLVKHRITVITVLMGIIIGCVSRTITANQPWVDDETIARHTLAVSFPGRFYNWKAYANLGKIYEDVNDFVTARLMFIKALDIAQGAKNRYVSARLYASLGNIDCFEGKFKDAIAHYCQAISLFPLNDEFFVGLGYAYIKSGEKEKAVFAWKKALAINPDNSDAGYNLELVSRR